MTTEPQRTRSASGQAPGGRAAAARAVAVPRDGSRTQAILLLVSFTALMFAWWFPFNVLLETPWIDITLLEPTLVVGAAVLTWIRAWRFVRRDDRIWLFSLAAFFVWMTLTGFIRMSGLDVRRAIAYGVFSGIAIATAFVAARMAPRRAGRWFVGFFVFAVVAALVGALLEHLTYDPRSGSDPLAWLWALFRPQQRLEVENIGLMRHAPLHFPLGPSGGIRTVGIFGQPLYMAFFGMLAAALMAAWSLNARRVGGRGTRVAALVMLGVAAYVTYWTYSRAPLAGLIGAVAGVITLDLITRWLAHRRLEHASLRAPAAVAVVLVAVLGAAVAADDALLRRFAGTAPAAAGGGEVLEGDSVEGSAARASQVRFELQGLAVDMVTASPEAMLIGPGMTAYEVGVRDLSPIAQRFTHPHSTWLTQATAGGLPAALLFATVLVVTAWRAFRALFLLPSGWRRSVALWAAAWIPVWSVVQFFGLNPLAPGESVIVGTMVGLGAGIVPRADTPSTVTGDTAESR